MQQPDNIVKEKGTYFNKYKMGTPCNGHAVVKWLKLFRSISIDFLYINSYAPFKTMVSSKQPKRPQRSNFK